MIEKTVGLKEFKETSIGKIPEDWKVQVLGDNSSLKARIGWQGLTTAEYLNNGEYNLITGTDFKNGKIDWLTCYYVEKQRYEQDSNIQVLENDILVTKDGTIGKVAFVDKVEREATLNSGVFVVRPLRNAYVPEYLYHILMSKVFKEFLNQLVAGSTISHLYQKDFVNFKFPVPDISEQKVIAEVLTDTDNLVQSLEKLIDKKKKIKQGAMQQLLTGKKRLTGMGDEWKVIRLKEHVKLQGGWAFKSSRFEDSGIPIIRIANIQENRVNIDEVVYSKDLYIPSVFKVNRNDVLIAMSGATTGKIGVYKSDGMAYLNQRVGKFVIKNRCKLSNYFLTQLVQSHAFKTHLDKYIAQGAQPNISSKQIESIEVKIPSNVKEQKAIAQVLSDMDAEIKALEEKLEKYKKIKQGMMQELLTGRIRLI